ncbi:MAG: flippase-like domain-containing protein [Clostridia bacterium]|nr:flippase-like domain-containing protein [Clostridia bacterium]
MTDDIINKEEVPPALKVSGVASISEPVLYNRQGFLSVLSHKITSRKYTGFSARGIAESIKNMANQTRTESIIEGAENTVAKQRSKKSRLMSTIFLIINLVVLVIVMYTQLSSEGAVSFEELINGQIKWGWLLLAFGFVLLLNVADAARLWVLIKFTTGRSRPWLSYKSLAIQRFYDNITPMASGGQAFQVFYLNKRGLPASSATSIPLAKYLYSQIILIAFDIIVLIIGHTGLANMAPLITTLCIVGLVLNVALIFLILFLSTSKKMGPSFAIGILKLLNKMRIIKDYRRTYVKVIKMVREYVDTSRIFMSNIWIVLSETFLSIINLLLHYSLPFLIYLAFGGPFDLNIWLEIMALTIVCDLAVCFIPVPGGAGMAELSFSTLFTSLFTFTTGSVAGWAVLLWRILTYYFYLLQGMLVMLYDFCIGNKKIQPLLDKFKAEDERRANQIMVVNKNKKRSK